jgi:hypothetical protein
LGCCGTWIISHTTHTAADAAAAFPPKKTLLFKKAQKIVISFAYNDGVNETMFSILV